LTQKKGEEKVLEKDIEAKAKKEIKSIEEIIFKRWTWISEN
jgi:hypothetical protein